MYIHLDNTDSEGEARDRDLEKLRRRSSLLHPLTFSDRILKENKDR